MKINARIRLLLILFSMIIAPIESQGTVDTLRAYNSKDMPMAYRQPDIVKQAARFDIITPCRLTSIRILLGGKTIGGKATLQVFGHEGGSSVPVLETDLINPITLTKQGIGNEWVEVSLPGGGIELTGRQFFVVISGLTAGVKLLTDNTRRIPTCTSIMGGTFWAQAIKHKDGRWEHGSLGYYIEPIVESHQTTTSPLNTFVRDTATIISNDTPIKSRAYTGISAGDINRDGFIDLLSNGRLYLNNTNGQFDDISEKAGMRSVTKAQVFVDIDTDGDLDILSLLPEEHEHPLLLINTGKGEFTPLEMNLPVSLEYATSISVGDVNNDEYPDLLIGQMPSLNDSAETMTLSPLLLLNTGKYSFIDRSSVLLPATLGSSREPQPHYTRGTSLLDLNRDGLLDLYVSNSFGYPDELYYNLGNMTFDRIEGPSSNSNIGLASGCQWIDSDNSGTLDITSPQIVKAHMKRTMPAAQTEIRNNAGISSSEQQIATNRQADINYEEYHSGCAWGDIDNNGTLDCILTTSCECRYATLYMQDLNKSLVDNTIRSGLRDISSGYDGMWVDIDNDGDLDFTTWKDHQIIIYKNTSQVKGNYIEVDLEALYAHQPIGTTLTVFAGGSRYTRDVIYGRGLSIQDPLRLHIGIGDNQLVDSVIVRWPGSPMEEIYTEPKVNAISHVKQGTGTVRIPKEGAIAGSITAYPNPFTDEAFFIITSPVAQWVKLELYSTSGEKILTLLHSTLEKGSHKISWDGTNSNGTQMSNGTYIYRFTLGKEEYSGKIILNK